VRRLKSPRAKTLSRQLSLPRVANTEAHNTAPAPAAEGAPVPAPEAVQLPKPEVVQLPKPKAYVDYVRPYGVRCAPSYGYRHSAGYHHCD
jgi:hypothetical protein